MPPKKKNGQRPVRLLRAAPTRKSPAFVTPMAAQVVKRLPGGDDWVYELKLDGCRALVVKDRGRVEIRSRKGKDLTGMYPRLAAAGTKLSADEAVVDGEIVALDTQGRPVSRGQDLPLRRASRKATRPDVTAANNRSPDKSMVLTSVAIVA